jgi:hypothetical protein
MVRPRRVMTSLGPRVDRYGSGARQRPNTDRADPVGHDADRLVDDHPPVAARIEKVDLAARGAVWVILS